MMVICNCTVRRGGRGIQFDNQSYVKYGVELSTNSFVELNDSADRSTI